jgi:glycerol-3-phosphate dehydrogenase (NAD(P)+)
MPEQITIIGDGAMGMVCALLLSSNGHRVRIWGAFPADIELLRSARENPRRLPHARLPDAIELTADDTHAFADTNLVICAVPTQHLRTVWTRLKPHFPASVPVVSCAKGIETSSLLRPTQIIAEVLGPAVALCALSGPNIAAEIARQLPATAVAAAAAPLTQRVQTAFSNRTFRVYTNDDVIGVEIAGAVKNIIALAAGMVDGLGLGCNAKAALLTRGLVEITRLGVAMGAREETFYGLAGLGDLVTTCISLDGRNRSTGEQLGKGRTLQEVLAGTASVVEGVPTTQAVRDLARRHKIEVPITEAVHAILFENVRPADALTQLMTRQSRAERQ